MSTILENSKAMLSNEEKIALQELKETDWFKVLKKIWEHIFPREVWYSLIRADLSQDDNIKAIIKHQDYLEWVLQFLALVEQETPQEKPKTEEQDDFIMPDYNPQ